MQGLPAHSGWRLRSLFRRLRVLSLPCHSQPVVPRLPWRCTLWRISNSHNTRCCQRLCLRRSLLEALKSRRGQSHFPHWSSRWWFSALRLDCLASLFLTTSNWTFPKFVLGFAILLRWACANPPGKSPGAGSRFRSIMWSCTWAPGPWRWPNCRGGRKSYSCWPGCCCTMIPCPLRNSDSGPSKSGSRSPLSGSFVHRGNPANFRR